MKPQHEERASIIDPGFSVADAELPSFETSEDGLIVRFNDWRENPVEVLFVDAVAHRWDEIDWSFLDGERFDSSHVILNYRWLQQHLDQNAFSEDEGYKHFRLNFNAGGTLQVIARVITIQTEQIVAANRLPAES